MSYHYQVVVIGSGSAGQEACLKAAKGGLRTLLVEERALGSNSFHGGSYAVRALRACANYLKATESAPKVGTKLDLIETSWSSWLSAQRRSSGRLSTEFCRVGRSGARWQKRIFSDSSTGPSCYSNKGDGFLLFELDRDRCTSRSCHWLRTGRDLGF